MAEPVLVIAGLEMQRGTGDSRFRMIVARLEYESAAPVLLTGENGSGKSSLLDVIGLVLKPTQAAQFTYHPRDAAPVAVADLLADGKDAALTDIRCSELGYMPQTGG